MINNISESVMRSTTKVDPNTVIHDKEMEQQKVEGAKQDRPVENSEAGGEAETKNSEDQGSSKFMQIERTMVFEKYDRNGDVILRIPPSSKPVNELV